MIIKKELVVSGRKRADIIKDLKTKGFKSFPKIVKKGEETEVDKEGDEEQEQDDSGPDNGYDYLLNVRPPSDLLAYVVDADLLAH
jgi:DNA topoisomerase II